MSLGKRKTRGSDTHCFGSIAELPDDGDLNTHKDVIGAAFHELEHNHEPSSNLLAEALVPKIKLNGIKSIQSWLSLEMNLSE